MGVKKVVFTETGRIYKVDESFLSSSKISTMEFPNVSDLLFTNSDLEALVDVEKGISETRSYYDGYMGVVEIDTLVEEFVKVKKAKEEAEEREKAIKEKFMEELSKRGTKALKTKKHKVVCTEVVSTRVDSKKLKEKFPGVFESCSYSSCSNRFNIK